MTVKKIEKAALSISIAATLFIALPVVARSMHIMEGYLPLGYSLAWGGICIPFVVHGIIKLRRLVANNRRSLILLAMAGAFIFVVSSLKIPSVTGSSSHMTGTGLGAILFGIGTTTILGAIVLLFQAILLAHGGLTTLGANVFSAAVFGPFVTYALFRAGMKLRVSKSICVFVSAALGCMLSYIATAVQLALAHPSEIGGFSTSLTKFLGVFAPTQVPLAIVEGLLTVLVIMGLENYASRELADISFIEASK